MSARSCTDHLFSAKIQPKPLPKHLITSFMLLCIMQYVNCKFGNVAGNLPGHNPAAYLGAFNAFLWPGTQTPPFESNHTRVPIEWAQAEPNVYLLFTGSGPEISEPPQMTTHQPTPQNGLNYIPIDSFWRQDSKYVIRISIDTWRQKLWQLQPPELYQNLLWSGEVRPATTVVWLVAWILLPNSCGS